MKTRINKLSKRSEPKRKKTNNDFFKFCVLDFCVSGAVFSGKMRLSSRRSSRVKRYVREKKRKTRGPPGAKSEKESKSKHESPTLVLVWLRCTATSRMAPKRKLRRTDRETHRYCLIECLIRHQQMTGNFHLFCEFSFHVSFSPLMQLVVQLLQFSSFSF